ncbi:MAG: hypothetical protein ACXVH1_30655 [Solirubrobacteraceae bacterium]
MRPDPVGNYHDTAGIRHDVLVRETRGGWQVLDRDSAAGRARVIDTLEIPVDGRPQAEAIARDYLTTIEPTSRQAGREPGEAIPEERVRDADSHRRPRPGPHPHPARRVALPGSAR